MAYGANGRSTRRPSRIGRFAALGVVPNPLPPDDATRRPANYDPECFYGTNTDLGNGLFCFQEADGSEKYYPTEAYTGKVPTFAEFSGVINHIRERNNAAHPELGAEYGAQTTQPFVYYNPSWYTYLGAAKVWQVQIGNGASLGIPGDFVPPSVGDPRAGLPEPPKTYIVDPLTGIKYEWPDGTNPDAPFFPDGRSINDALYGPKAQRKPGQPGYVAPPPPVVQDQPPIQDQPPPPPPPNGGTTTVIHDDDVDDYTPTGSGGGGYPPPSPPSYPPPGTVTTGPVTTPKPPTTPNVNVSPAPAPAGGAGMGTGTIALLALGAFFLFGRKRS